MPRERARWRCQANNARRQTRTAAVTRSGRRLSASRSAIGKVKTHCRYGALQLHVVVEDNGPGVAPVKDRLFSPFVTTKAQGTGLGLVMPKKLPESLAATLSSTTARLAGRRLRCGCPLVAEHAVVRRRRRRRR